MLKNRPVQSLDSIRKKLLEEYALSIGHGGWRVVGKRYGISPGTLNRIAMEGYEPSDSEIRKKLELPVYIKVAVCPVCGKVHLAKKFKHGEYQHISDIPVSILLWKLENREEF